MYGLWIITIFPLLEFDEHQLTFKDEAHTALLEDPVRTAQ